MTSLAVSETSRESAGAERLLVASSDAHVSAPLAHYREYCPQQYLEDFDDYAKAAAKIREEDRARNAFASAQQASGRAQVNQEFLSQTLIHYDPHVALQHMDEDGVAVETFFHGASNGEPIPFLGIVGGLAHKPLEGPRGFELAQVGLRMYNRLMADYCSIAPERLIGLAYLPLWDVEAAVKEIEFARQAGLRGINFPAPRRTVPDYDEPVWEPLWSAAESHGMPLSTHVGNSPMTVDLASYTGPSALQSLIIDGGYLCRRGLHFMMFGGVFERHPGLKLIFAEQSPWWVEPTLSEWDSLAEMTAIPSSLPRKPSEYFASNCFVGASFMSNAEARSAVARGITSKVLWGRDYPHLEGCWPYTRLSLRKAVEGVPTDAVRQMLGENLVELYQLDRAKLSGIADRIGPTIEEITTPLPRSEIPDHAQWTLAFRDSQAFFR